ncbi:CPBP family intramembrane glutamic endopeptidase [Duncaniella freteri]|uniref:CPBP family intramembrane metalloprotease n=14 Tax=Duncaniella TaxID=2518495 RepID=A0A4Z0V4N1_9BACT|nr:CPBP family intramembrane glutamic endopeptidase [Duncaniella freteri]TGG36303.1 CPBP family intramembrane metalloprotease [Duncaniella freteri]
MISNEPSLNPLPSLRYSYLMRIFYFLLITFVSLIITVVTMSSIIRGGHTTELVRIATVVQDVALFILPAIITAVIVSPLPARLLCIDRKPSASITILAFVALMCSIPAMNMIVEWNENITLPQSLEALEEWMRKSEETARAQVEILLGGASVADLIINILIVGVLAGFSEEIFFRGAMQRLLSSGSINYHAAIWLTAFLFSAFHIQFFGFFPRLLLGAFFGYLLYWSGSILLPALMHAINNSIVVYSMWQSNISPEVNDTDINSWGSDSIIIVMSSILLTSVAIYLLKNINKTRNGVTR